MKPEDMMQEIERALPEPTRFFGHSDRIPMYSKEEVVAFAAKLCEAKDKELRESVELRRQYFVEMCAVIEKNDVLVKELQAAKAQIAMKDEALRALTDVCVTQIGADYNDIVHAAYLLGKQALSSTSAESEAWLREEKAKVLEEAAKGWKKYSEYFGEDVQDELIAMTAELRKNGD